MNFPMVICVFSSSGYLVGTSYRTIVQVAVPGTLDLSNFQAALKQTSCLETCSSSPSRGLSAVIFKPELLQQKPPNFFEDTCLSRSLKFFFSFRRKSRFSLLRRFSEQLNFRCRSRFFFFRAPGLLPRASKLGQKIIEPVADG